MNQILVTRHGSGFRVSECIGHDYVDHIEQTAQDVVDYMQGAWPIGTVYRWVIVPKKDQRPRFFSWLYRFQIKSLRRFLPW